MRSVFWAFAALLALGSVAASQEPTALEPGARVRITARLDGPEPSRVVGTLLAMTPEEMRIRLAADTAREIQVPRDAITRLEVSHGQHSKLVTGLGLGFAGGAAVGAVLGRLTRSGDLAARDATLIGAGFGAVLGTLSGAIIGGGARVDRWERVPLVASLTPSSAEGARLALTFRYRF